MGPDPGCSVRSVGCRWPTALAVPKHPPLRSYGLGCANRSAKPASSRLMRTHASLPESVSTAVCVTGPPAQQASTHDCSSSSWGVLEPTRPQMSVSPTAAVSTGAAGIPFSQSSRSLLFPGIVLGALLTLALQRAWVWAHKAAGVPLPYWSTDALTSRRNSNEGASTSGRDSGSVTGGDGSARAWKQGKPNRTESWPGASGATTIQLPDTPELRDVFNSLTDAMNPMNDSGHSQLKDQGESVEWVNMCWRKAWRVYQRGLERWISDLLQPVFDGVVKDGSVPKFVQRLRIVEFTLDHEAPYFTNMRRRYSRKDSDLTGVVDLRYTGGARMLLMLEVGGGRWRFKIPVLVSDLDIDCQMWIKIRLAPMCPWIGTLSVAFVGPPNVKVQLSPYNRVRLMRVPVVQNFLRKLLTVDLPGLMVLPKRLEVAIPPSVTSVAEAAVGRDTIMRAVASAVLQADAVEQALLAALPLGPQTPAGGITLPEAFRGELDLVLREARDLPVWGFPGQSNPYVRMLLGEQAVLSRRDDDTSSPGRHRHPVWNQEFQFLVEDPTTQKLEIAVRDSHLTGRVEVGSASLQLSSIPRNGDRVSIWLALTPPSAYASRGAGGEKVPQGEVLVEVAYKAFDEEYDEQDSGYREAQAFQSAITGRPLSPDGEQERITDIRSAAAASSRAAVAASAAYSAIAMTKAAAARAATRAARAAQAAAEQVAGLPKSPGPPALPGPGGTTRSASVGKVSQSASEVVVESVVEEPLVVLVPGEGRPPSQSDDTTSIGAGSEDSEDDGEGRELLRGAGEGGISERWDAEVAAANGQGWHPGLERKAVMGPQYDRLSHHYHKERTGGYPVRESIISSINGSGVGGTLGGTPAAVGVGAGVGKGVSGAGGVKTVKVAAGATAVGATAVGASSPGAPVVVGAGDGGGVETRVPAGVQASVSGVDGGGGGDVNPEVATATALMRAHQAAEAAAGAVRVTVGEVSVEGVAGQMHASEVGVSINGSAPGNGTNGWSGTDSSNGMSHELGAGQGAFGSRGGADGSVSSSLVEVAHAELDALERATGVLNGVSSTQGGGEAAQQVVGLGADGATLVEGAPQAGDKAGGTTAPPTSQHIPVSLVMNRVHDIALSWGSAIGQARKSLGSGSGQQGQAGTEGASQGPSAADVRNSESWLGAVLAALSVLTSSLPAQHQDKDKDKGQANASRDGEEDGVGAGVAPVQQSRSWWAFWSGDSVSATTGSEGGSVDGAAGARGAAGDQKQEGGAPWWRFWGKGGLSGSVQEKEKVEGAAASGGSKEGAQDKEEGGQPWWKFWGKGKGSGDDDGEGRGQGTGEGGNKPVDAIIIPPDLPLEEIAKEVARLKDENWRSKEERVETLWARAVERNDRPWIMLCAALLAVACVLLTAVAWRLDHVPSTTDADITVPLATMQLLLQMLNP